MIWRRDLSIDTALKREIHQLPDKYKAVFNMAVIDGYTHKQISQELGIKESTSRSLLKRAREKITRRIIAVKIKEGIR